MAGDIVGASTFESFIQNDKPTIDAMNEAGLEVSAAGNHEFDQGYDDLMDRIMSATTPTRRRSRLALHRGQRPRRGHRRRYALETDREDGNFAHSNGATWWKDFAGLAGGDGIRVGFVGAVTEDLDSLVAPARSTGSRSPASSTRSTTRRPTSRSTAVAASPATWSSSWSTRVLPARAAPRSGADEDSTFGRIVHGASADVDAIVSGHTHLKYNCKVDVAGKTLDRARCLGRPVRLLPQPAASSTSRRAPTTWWASASTSWR